MNIPILRTLLLTCAGNAYLRGGDPKDLWPHASVFVFSKTCDFRDVSGGGDRLIAPDPLAWLATLRGARGLRLHHAMRPREPGQTLAVPDRQLAGFVGGGPAWLIEVVGVKRSFIWQDFDRLGDRNDAERKIWLTTYLRIGETNREDAPSPPLARVSDGLDATLKEIGALAERMQFSPFDEIFADARAKLHGDLPRDHGMQADFHRYTDFGFEQHRLLAAVSSAWVFGGMGSWNDIVPDEPHKADYERLSENLYVTLNDAICALANSTFRA